MLAAALFTGAPARAAAEAAAPAQPPTPAPAAPATGPSGEAGAVTLTLDEAIRIALANNPGLQAAQGQQRSARTRIGEARAAAGPTVNAAGNINFQGPIPEFTLPGGQGQPARRVTLGSSRTRTADIEGTYRPDISGRTRSSARIAEHGAEAAEAATAANINTLTLQVQSNYYGTLRAQDLVEVRRQAVGAAQEQLRVAQAQFRAGTVPQFDVLRASVQVENLRQNQTVAENQARIAVANLINTLGIDPSTPVRLTPVPVTPLPPPLPPAAPGGVPGGAGAPPPAPAAPGAATAPAAPGPQTPAAPNPPAPTAPTPRTPPGPTPASGQPLPLAEDEAFREALSRRPEVQQAQENVRLNRERIRFEARARRPELALFGSYTLTPDATGLAAVDHQWRVGANLSVNVFDAGLIRSRVRQAEADRDTAQAQLVQVQQSVALEVRTALLNLREAQERRQTTAANVQQAQEALRIAQVRYRSGVSTNVEVTDAQVALTDAETNQVNAEYDYLNAEAALARALGRYAPPTAGSASPPGGARR